MKMFKVMSATVVLLALFAVWAIAQQPPSVDATRYTGIYTSSFGLQDAAGETVGDTVWHLSATADFDSSLTFDAQTWDRIWLQALFFGGDSFAGADTTPAASRDSNNVTIYVMGSLTGNDWLLIDSVEVTDTVWTYKTLAWTAKWPWAKFAVHGGAEVDSAGAVGQIRAGAYGVK